MKVRGSVNLQGYTSDNNLLSLI